MDAKIRTGTGPPCLVPALLLSSAAARAEPAVSRWSLLPSLLVVVTGTILCAAIPWVMRRRAARRRAWWVYALASVALAALFFVFLAPVIVVFMNIMITGRTM